MVAPQNQSITESAITKPAVAAYPNGGNSIKSAAQNTSAANTRQSSALSKMGGGRKRSKSRRRSMRGGAIPITTPTTGYAPAGANGQSVGGVSTKLASLQATGAENAKNDGKVGQSGGVKWGCHSGGKKNRTKKNRKLRKKSRYSRK
jgi:hypothetical protein